MKTYKEAYLWGSNKLQEADIIEYELDARLLLEGICHTGRTDLLVHGDRELTEEQLAEYEKQIEKRSCRIPLQHIQGMTEFMGLSFHVNENVLCPRQDTEVLVEEVLRNLHDGMRILDMCTGSGCILLSLLHYSNNCVGVGVDFSKEALEVAQENEKLVFGRNKESLTLDLTDQQELMESQVERQELMESQELSGDLGLCKPNISWIHSDLFDRVSGKYEIIVSNPPYIPTKVVDTLMPEVREHEPRMALDGMEDGLFFYRKIVDRSVDYLSGGGMLFFEIGCDQAADVSHMMEEKGFREVQVVKDFAGLDRVVFGTWM